MICGPYLFICSYVLHEELEVFVTQITKQKSNRAKLFISRECPLL